jgi:hypothetical protein
MNAPIRKSVLLAAAAAMVSLFPAAASAKTKVEVDKPKIDNIPSPQFAGVKGESWSPKDWLKIEARLKVAMSPAPKSNTCDTLTVKWYVAVENPDKPSTYLKLIKEIQHVNIPLDEDVYACVFLSPASIRRLTGSDRASKNSVKFVGIEVVSDGEPATAAIGKDKWWTMPSDKISDSSTVPLLSKAETPFAAMWWDRYAEEKSLGAQR